MTLWEVERMRRGFLTSFLVLLLLCFSFANTNEVKDEFSQEELIEISKVVNEVLAYYLKMEFEKMLPYMEEKAKKDTEQIISYTASPYRYNQIKSEISLLSEPRIEEISKVSDDIAYVVVKWGYNRSVVKGTKEEKVKVSRESRYILKKFGKNWKIVSYR